MLNAISLGKGTPLLTWIFISKPKATGSRYKDAGEALRRRQDKEREAAGLPPVQRMGTRGVASGQRGQRSVPARGSSGLRGLASVGRSGSHGGGGPMRTIHADKNVYVHLLGHLKKETLLPVVIFTFSKKRCEENAETLTNADLCTSADKSEVHVAIEKALSRLKGEGNVKLQWWPLLM